MVELAHELEGHVLEAVMCPHANYVVQKVVSHLSVAASSFVAFELMGHAVKVAKHRRTAQRETEKPMSHLFPFLIIE